MTDFIQRKSSPIGRLYYIEEKQLLFPSVTTILSVYEDESLKQLEKELGEKKWNEVSTRGANRGTIMHLYLENYFQNYFQVSISHKECLKITLDQTYQQIINNYTLEEIEVGKNLFYNFYHSENWLNNIKELLWSEKFVYSINGMFGGTADFGYINMLDNIIGSDFKSSKTKKSKVPTYKMQISAYSKGIKELYNYDVSKAEILISCEDSISIQKIFLDKNEINKEYSNFLDLRDTWFNKNKDILKEELVKLKFKDNKLF